MVLCPLKNAEISRNPKCWRYSNHIGTFCTYVRDCMNPSRCYELKYGKPQRHSRCSVAAVFSPCKVMKGLLNDIMEGCACILGRRLVPETAELLPLAQPIPMHYFLRAGRFVNLGLLLDEGDSILSHTAWRKVG